MLTFAIRVQIKLYCTLLLQRNYSRTDWIRSFLGLCS